MNKKAVLEGLLFVIGEDGLSMDQIADVLEVDKDEVKSLVKALKEEYENDSRGLRIDFLGNKLKITTKREHKDYYKKLIENKETNFLSKSSLETLAIIAYNEPITRVQIDEYRGVSSIQIIRKLVAKGLIKEAGRSNIAGRPILYETTTEFLDYFGLASINDLPDMRNFISKTEEDAKEVDLYHSKYKDDSSK